MKKIYEFLQVQTHAFAICILFGISPYIPTVLQQNFGVQSDWPAIYCFIMLLSGAFIFALGLLWLKMRFILMKPGYMLAIFLGSILAILISFSALLALYGHGSSLYLIWRTVPAWVLMGLILGAIAWQKLKGDFLLE